jgi:hypothetical protein
VTEWLLLLHQISPKPAYLRAKVLRRLNQLGALPIKNSAYLILQNEANLEDFQWLRGEIEQQGGAAWLFRTKAIAGLSDDSIREAFRELRRPDYEELIGTARALITAGITESEWQKLRHRAEDLRRIDFFEAPGRDELEAIMDQIERTLRPPTDPVARPRLAGLSGATWVTRRGVKVDRTASAWLIRRFIDPAARFVFVEPEKYTHSPGELRFDMYEGEFTHEGDACTFEVLLDASGRRSDPALAAIAEMIHDLDLRDTRYQRPETPGVAAMIDGIMKRHSDDVRRLEDSAALYDSLYASLGGK